MVSEAASIRAVEFVSKPFKSAAVSVVSVNSIVPEPVAVLPESCEAESIKVSPFSTSNLSTTLIS